MKKSKQNPKMKSIFLTVCLLMISVFVNAQDVKPKNNISLGAGISIPFLTSDSNSELIASSGSNLSLSYGRKIYTGKKGYYALEARFSNFSNAYSKLDSDLKEVIAISPSSLGTWSGTCDNFKLSSYLLGVSWNEYISTDEKWTCFAKLYLGSGSLTSPTESFKATSGVFMTQNELKSSSFVYSTCVGISYEITKNISFGVNAEFLKSNFTFNNQQITYNLGGSMILPQYTINYSNLGLNTGLTFKF